MVSETEDSSENSSCNFKERREGGKDREVIKDSSRKENKWVG